jgi:hypothetical protein
MTFHSPNDLLKAAREMMLEGRKPVSYEDWVRVFNFLAFNIATEVQPEALLVFRHLYDVPLTDEEIREISAFHMSKKGKK